MPESRVTTPNRTTATTLHPPVRALSRMDQALPDTAIMLDGGERAMIAGFRFSQPTWLISTIALVRLAVEVVKPMRGRMKRAMTHLRVDAMTFIPIVTAVCDLAHTKVQGRGGTEAGSPFPGVLVHGPTGRIPQFQSGTSSASRGGRSHSATSSQGHKAPED
jgi:hypothetical protein